MIIDYANLVNTAQRHTKCNSVYCLRVIHKGIRVVVFIIISRNNRDLQFSTKKPTKKDGDITAEIVPKRNDSKINEHRRIQLQICMQIVTSIWLLIIMHVLNIIAKAEKLLYVMYLLMWFSIYQMICYKEQRLKNLL